MWAKQFMPIRPSCSEVELHGQLDLTWPARTGSSAHRAKSSESKTASARSAGQIGYVACSIECRRHIEETPIRVIPDVEKLGADLKGPRFLAERKILEDRH